MNFTDTFTAGARYFFSFSLSPSPFLFIHLENNREMFQNETVLQQQDKSTFTTLITLFGLKKRKHAVTFNYHEQLISKSQQ